MKDFIATNLEMLIAGLALLVSALSVIITLYWNRRTFKHQVEHDQLSVKPLVHSGYDYSEGILTVSLYNPGIGPLIIKNLEYRINGKLYEHLNFMAIDEKYLSDLHLRDIIIDMKENGSYGTLEPYTVIPSDGKFELYCYDYQSANNAQQKVSDIISQIKIVLEYEDIYENKYSIGVE